MNFRLIIILIFIIRMSMLPETKAAAYIYNVSDFGATGDGETLDSPAIQRAIDTCTANGGGEVLLPAGIFLSGSLVLKDHVTLHISEGAALLGSKNIGDYKEFRPSIPSYNDSFLKHSLIYAENATNIALIGKGKIDGQGGSFEVKTKKKPDRYMNRPYIIRLVACKNVRVEDLTLTNSAMWMQHYFACEDVYIRGLYVYNHCNKNNDMIDIDGCKNVVVSDCIGDTDDDAMTIKSTSGIVSENITITNCVLSSHCNAIKCGTESHAGFKNITISNCVVKPSAHPTNIYGSPSGIGGIILGLVDGGVMDGITVSNIRIDGPTVPIYMRLGDRGRIYKEGMDRPPVGQYRNVRISNIIATGAESLGCSITGLPGHPVENISLSNISITFKGGGTLADAQKKVPELPEHYPEGTMFGKLPSYGFYVRHAVNISMNSITLMFENNDQRPALICNDVDGMNISGFFAQGSPQTPGLIYLINSRDVFITNSRPLNEVALFLNVQGESSERIGVFNNDLRLAGKKVNLAGDVEQDVVRVQ